MNAAAKADKEDGEFIKSLTFLELFDNYFIT